MVIENKSNVGRANVGLRTKYYPKNRIGHSLVSAAPWLDILLLILCFVMLESKFVLQHGVTMDIPSSSFKGMVKPGMVAVVRSVAADDNGARKEIIFFDDERFITDDDSQMKSLGESFANHVSRRNESGILIYADKDVRHGTLVSMFNMLREAGVVRINTASRPEGLAE